MSLANNKRHLYGMRVSSLDQVARVPLDVYIRPVTNRWNNSSIRYFRLYSLEEGEFESTRIGDFVYIYMEFKSFSIEMVNSFSCLATCELL